MATWVRTGTGTAPSGTDADVLPGNITLDNATAPADFDPAGVTSVRFQFRYTVTGIVDDSWLRPNRAYLGDGTNTGAQVNNADGTITTNGDFDHDFTDSSPVTTYTTGQWEGFSFNSWHVSITTTPWSTVSASMKADVTTLTVPVANAIVTITYTPAAPALDPSDAYRPTVSFPQADISVPPPPWWVAEAGNSISTSQLSITINKPTGTAEGDIMYAAISHASGTGSSPDTPPSGWTDVGTNPTEGSGGSFWLYKKTAGASEPTDYTFTFNIANQMAGAIVTTRGMTEDVTNEAAVTYGTNISLTLSGMSTSATGLLGFVGGDAGIPDADYWTPTSGMTKVSNYFDSTGPIVETWYETIASLTSTTETFTESSNSDAWIGLISLISASGDKTLTPGLYSPTVSFPSARLDSEINGVSLYSPTVTIYAGQLNLELTAPVVNVTPTFGTATIFQSDVKGALYSVTPTFPTGILAQSDIKGSLLTVSPTFSQADINLELTAPLLTVTPTFGTATVYQSDIKGATVSVSTTFPQANIATAGAPQELTVPSTFGVSTTLFNATFEIELEANLLTVSPSLPQARLDLQITPGLLSVNPTYFLAELAGDGGPQVLTPDLFSPGVSIYSGVIDIPVVGPTVSISPVWPSGSLDFEILAPTLNIISIITDPGWEFESTVGTVTVPLTFYGADLIQDQFLLANLLTVIVTFPSGFAGLEGGPISVADGTDFSGILQQMVVARGGPATLDFLGSLNYLAGTDDLDLLEVLNILGSVAGTDLLEAIWQITADAGPRADLNLITKRWAESGNF